MFRREQSFPEYYLDSACIWASIRSVMTLTNFGRLLGYHSMQPRSGMVRITFAGLTLANEEDLASLLVKYFAAIIYHTASGIGEVQARYRLVMPGKSLHCT